MNISKRLTACLNKGNLTVADLARWFERPDPTVRGWAKGGSVGGPPGDVADVEHRLAHLERLIKAGKHFPVPRMSRLDRAYRLEHLRGP